eukprot:jgi/Chlat1/6026/Chrsp4S09085
MTSLSMPLPVASSTTLPPLQYCGLQRAHHTEGRSTTSRAHLTLNHKVQLHTTITTRHRADGEAPRATRRQVRMGELRKRLPSVALAAGSFIIGNVVRSVIGLEFETVFMAWRIRRALDRCFTRPKPQILNTVLPEIPRKAVAERLFNGIPTLFVGASASGKTTAIHQARDCCEGRIGIAYMSFRQASLQAAVTQAFGVGDLATQTTLDKLLDIILRVAKSFAKQGKKVVLIIDDVHDQVVFDDAPKRGVFKPEAEQLLKWALEAQTHGYLDLNLFTSEYWLQEVVERVSGFGSRLDTYSFSYIKESTALSYLREHTPFTQEQVARVYGVTGGHLGDITRIVASFLPQNNRNNTVTDEELQGVLNCIIFRNRNMMKAACTGKSAVDVDARDFAECSRCLFEAIYKNEGRPVSITATSKSCRLNPLTLSRVAEQLTRLNLLRDFPADCVAFDAPRQLVTYEQIRDSSLVKAISLMNKHKEQQSLDGEDEEEEVPKEAQHAQPPQV